jgi:hypothetical protein
MRKNQKMAGGRAHRRETNISAYPASPDDVMRAVLSISKADAKRIIASKPGKKRS